MIKIARDFVKSKGFDVSVVEWNGSLGNYNKENDVISLNMRKIKKMFSHHRKEIPYIKSTSDYIKLITCHELGHRDDKEISVPVSEVLNKITEKYEDKLFLVEPFCNDIRDAVMKKCLAKEKRAWELGKKYVCEERMNDYNLMNEDYLKDHKEWYDSQITELFKIKVQKVRNNIDKEIYSQSNSEIK